MCVLGMRVRQVAYFRSEFISILNIKKWEFKLLNFIYKNRKVKIFYIILYYNVEFVITYLEIH